MKSDGGDPLSCFPNHLDVFLVLLGVARIHADSKRHPAKCWFPAFSALCWVSPGCSLRASSSGMDAPYVWQIVFSTEAHWTMVILSRWIRIKFSK
jgi:hypothetical protein